MAKPAVTMYEGETIVQRPNMIRARYTLSNGQLLSVYFTRKRVKNKDAFWRGVIYVWSVAIHIGSGRRGANKWFNSWTKRPIQETGTCGLEGLIVASRYIRAFGQHKIGSREEMQIGWADAKRMRAYRWLLRYPGFAWYADDANEGQCIAYRNPDIYEWIPKKDEPVSVDPNV
jgi:hypothetical protein